MTLFDRRLFVLGIVSACMLAALGAHGDVRAQEPTNLSVNAQLLVPAQYRASSRQAAPAQAPGHAPSRRSAGPPPP